MSASFYKLTPITISEMEETKKEASPSMAANINVVDIIEAPKQEPSSPPKQEPSSPPKQEPFVWSDKRDEVYFKKLVDRVEAAQARNRQAAAEKDDGKENIPPSNTPSPPSIGGAKRRPKLTSVAARTASFMEDWERLPQEQQQQQQQQQQHISAGLKSGGGAKRKKSAPQHESTALGEEDTAYGTLLQRGDDDDDDDDDDIINQTVVPRS